MGLLFGVGILFWVAGFIKFIIDSLLGNVKKSIKVYFFDKEILKPLGYTYKDYNPYSIHGNELSKVLRVQKQLEKVANEKYFDYCYLSIMSDLCRNKEIEQEFKNQLVK